MMSMRRPVEEWIISLIDPVGPMSPANVIALMYVGALPALGAQARAADVTPALDVCTAHPRAPRILDGTR